ncbi:MAG: threonine--tRNA ligase, partial [Candidatus Thermoplasmatota archaeon]
RVMIYPYAHLSPSLAPPELAVPVLKGMEEHLRSMGLEVHRAPFGWYKSFEIRCKGHPLSELSKEIRPGGRVSEALEAEKKISSAWYILDMDGALHPISLEHEEVVGYRFNGLNGLRRFCEYEMAKSRAAGKEPPHVALMQRLELADYEPGSDPGHFRYYPKGRLIKALLEKFVTDRVIEAGGMEVETPMMYDVHHPALKEYLHRFPARQYTIRSPDKETFLRFAACFGQFLMMHDATISYRDLPARIYELAKYSFRVEQRGELTGLRRLRAFTMPDCHSFCADMEGAVRELMDRFELSWEIMSGIGFDLPRDMEMAVRATEDFWKEHESAVVSLVRKWGKPVLVEMWSERFFYFTFKYEWNFIDALGKCSALNTDQIDVENAARYGIVYIGADGKEHHPLILHQSPSGAIERVLYALLERQQMRQERGEKPELPFWLSPTQVRLIPVSQEYVEDCVALASKLNARADVDDREETVGKRIRDAEREWISMILVYGEKERTSGKLAVRLRDGTQGSLTHDGLSRTIASMCEGYPKAPLPLPILLSRRIVFRG